MKIILASGSPRKIEVLGKLGVKFEQFSADIDESPHKNEPALDYVQRLAIEKAQTIYESASKLYKDEDLIIIGADLVVNLGDKILGKAENGNQAFEILKSLSGTEHFIRNGLAIMRNNEIIFAGVETTIMQFKKLSDEIIQTYIDHNIDEWHDKAGAYAAQGVAAKFVNQITGSYFNLISLPIFPIAEVLISLGIKIRRKNLELLRKEDAKNKRKFS
jgi:septum formation protein